MHSLLYLEIIINVCTFLINNVSGDIATDCIGGSFSGNFHNCDGKDITEKQQTSQKLMCHLFMLNCICFIERLIKYMKG